MKYNDSKADKNADRLSEKNLYANPHDWKLCSWTAVGIYLSLQGEEKFNENSHLVLNKDAVEGTAATSFCEEIQSVVLPHVEEISVIMEVSKFNPYDFTKGSASYVVSGTTQPPPLTSVCRRVEWSIGKVLDTYWHFGTIGDQYLGPVLAGLDPNRDGFDTLPPHWILADPMSNACIAGGIAITFGTTFNNYSSFRPILLRYFAYITYHAITFCFQFQRRCSQFCKVKRFA